MEAVRVAQRSRHFVPAAFDTLPAKPGDLKIFDKSRKTLFYHSGDFGDIIYALPTIRALGGGDLVLGPEMKLGFDVKTRQTLTLESFNVIAPLLRLQPYLNSVRFSPVMPEVDIDLNRFRRYFLEEAELRRKGDRRLNLAETHLWTFQQPLEACTTPWLVVDRAVTVPGRPVLLHRSPRWRNHEFPWDRVLEVHGDQAAFVGLSSEYREFIKDWGHIRKVPYIPTDSFLQLARLIAGSLLYVGNQSAPYAIAEGLKKNTLQEVWPEGPNCLFPRENAYYGDGKLVYIPKPAKTMTTEITNCPMCSSRRASTERTRADIVKCEDCETVYLRTRPSKESMEARYQTYADGSSHMRLPVTVDEMRTSGLRREYFMQELLPYVDSPGGLMGTLLDVGCGWGAFLANAREKGFEVMGIEICAKMANFANSVMGLKVIAQQLEDYAFPFKGTYNVISIIHVFEHLPNQKKALEVIYELLRPKGIFCGIVPNYGSLCSKSMRDQWAWLDPEMHYVHFTPKSLAAALEKQGFKILKLYTHTGDFDVPTIVEQVRKESNMPMSSEEVAARIEAHWNTGEGEEIRFFAQK